MNKKLIYLSFLSGINTSLCSDLIRMYIEIEQKGLTLFERQAINRRRKPFETPKEMLIQEIFIMYLLLDKTKGNVFKYIMEHAYLIVNLDLELITDRITRHLSLLALGYSLPPYQKLQSLVFAFFQRNGLLNEPSPL